MKSHLPVLTRLLTSLLFSFPAVSLHTAAQAQSAAAHLMPATAYKLIAVKVTGTKRFTQQEVETAIVITIKNACSAARRINDIARFGSGDMGRREPYASGYVFERGDGGKSTTILFGRCRDLGQWNTYASGLLTWCLCLRIDSGTENQETN